MTQTAQTHLQLLARADLVLLVADLLRSPSIAADQLAVPAEILDELLDRSALNSPPLLAALRDALASLGHTPTQSWSDEYHRLFEGAMACPANETAYIRRDKGALIADIGGFYRAFGFAPRPDTGEKPDHLLTQLEFLAMLLVMLATAAANGDDDKQDITRSALVSFAESHLGDWLGSFCQRLMATSSLDFYSAAAAALRRLWDALAAAHNFPPPAVATLDPQHEPESPYECAAAPQEELIDLRIPRPRDTPSP